MKGLSIVPGVRPIYTLNHQPNFCVDPCRNCNFRIIFCSFQSLLGDVRMLVNFIQDQHGNPFRRVGLSALLDAIDKTPKLERLANLPVLDLSIIITLDCTEIFIFSQFEMVFSKAEPEPPPVILTPKSPHARRTFLRLHCGFAERSSTLNSPSSPRRHPHLHISVPRISLSLEWVFCTDVAPSPRCYGCFLLSWAFSTIYVHHHGVRINSFVFQLCV